MSTRKFPEKCRDIESWVRWVSQDADGTWWGFETEPNLGTISWYENEVGRVTRLCKEVENPEWKLTLMRIEELLEATG